MRRLVFFIVLLTVFYTMACDDVLNQKPTGQYSDEAVWNDIDLAETFVNEQYQDIIPRFRQPQQNATLNLASISEDSYVRFNYQNANVIRKGELSPDNETGFGAWSTFWNSIRNCNLFLSKIKDVPGDTAKKRRLTGEVHFLRSWSYFELIKRFGGVPIIKKVFKLHDDYQEARKTYDQSTKFIVSELDTAASELPTSYSDDNIGRVTKGAALGLKSRVLLFAASALNNPDNDKSKWQDAANAAKEVINMGEYHLFQGQDYRDLFMQNWNPSIIFARPENPNPDFGGYNENFQVVQAPNGYHGWSANSPSQNLVNAFLMENGKPITDPVSGYDPNHPYQNRDPRFYADIVHNDMLFYGRRTEFYKGGKDSQEGGIDTWNASLTGYTLRKYFDENIAIGSSNLSNRAFPLIRLAEMYLNYAEAEFHLNNEGVARNYLNMLRKRPSVNLPELQSSIGGIELLDAIRRERRLDLCFEGHHYWDLLRWKLAMNKLNGSLDGIVITKKSDGSFSYDYQQVAPLTFKEKMYRFPLPQQTMQNTDLEQNPGY